MSASACHNARNAQSRTESAKLSSSCPSMLLSFLHLATLPSNKSNSMPKKGAHSAILYTDMEKRVRLLTGQAERVVKAGLTINNFGCW